MKFKLLDIVLITFLLFFCSFVNAGLIGLSSGFPGKIYSIDSMTGFATELVSTEFTSIVGASFLDGNLYGTDVCDSSCFSMGTFDLDTGLYTLVNNQDGSSNWHGLASDEFLGLLYTIDLNDSNKLKSITSSGVVTTIGSGTGINGRGMAYDDGNDILYATDGGALYSVDVLLGTSTLIGTTGVANNIGLAFDENTGTLYANAASSLYILDVTSGASTLVGSNGVGSIDGLAWLGVVDVPEPSTLAIFSLALMGLASRRFKKS
ncbi:MAG: PEP-CTERM sorting domain-containing protein [Colwellia sp.]|nr:PEP-CTERM sorting domain-containing protein [Colwellia sp.]